MRIIDTLKNFKKGTENEEKAVVIAVVVTLAVVLLTGVLAPGGLLEALASGGDLEIQAGTEGESLETELMTVSVTQDEELTELTELSELTEDTETDANSEDEADSAAAGEADSEDSSPYDLTDTVEVPDVEFPYYIKVNRQANCVTVYTLDENGEYTVPIKAMVCSVGLNDATPLGVYTTTDKYEWRALYGNVYGQYAFRIHGSIMFHSVPYYTTNKDDLETEEYNKLGEAASMGCIRLSCIDAKWLVDNCPSGTTVEIYDDEDPGPLGKPTAIKIDPDSPYAGWDPTDPDPDNPWNSIDESEFESESGSELQSESESKSQNVESASEPESESQSVESAPESESESQSKESESQSKESESESQSQGNSEPESESQGRSEPESESQGKESEPESQSGEQESESESESQSEKSEPESEKQTESEVKDNDTESASSEVQEDTEEESQTQVSKLQIAVKSETIVITIAEEKDIRSCLLANLDYDDSSGYSIALSYSQLASAVSSRKFGAYTCSAYIYDNNSRTASEAVYFTVKYVPSSAYADYY